MITASSGALFSSRESYLRAFAISLLVFIISQISATRDVLLHLAVLDNDDAMRLLSVRDMLGGQSWYDTTQYRILPPEGISLHWSRYIDVVLAGLMGGLSLLMDSSLAERMASVLWPFGLFIAYLGLVGSATRALFGVPAACYAVLGASLVPVFSQNYFTAGRVDHHNVQIIAMLTIICATALPGRARLFGAIAGAGAAFSLAVGLETIPVIACTGIILTVRYVRKEPEAVEQLTAFGLALGIVAPILFVGQTSPALWLTPACDALSLPWLGLTTAAATLCLTLSITSRFLNTSTSRAALIVGIGLLASLALLPVLKNCLGGPYASLPEEIQRDVIGTIGEALPIYRAIFIMPSIGLSAIGPLLIAALAVTFLLLGRIRNNVHRDQHRTLLTLIVFLWLGILLSLIQIRASIVGWTVLPIVMGLVASELQASTYTRATLWKSLQSIILLALMMGQTWYLLGHLAETSSQPITTDDNCTHPNIIDALNVLAPTRVLAPLNFGPRILLKTSHTVLSAPYHRSAASLANGVLPFDGDEVMMRKVVDRHQPDYIVVCRGQVYGQEHSFGTALARGQGAPWLAREEITEASIIIWRVRRHETSTDLTVAPSK